MLKNNKLKIYLVGPIFKTEKGFAGPGGYLYKFLKQDHFNISVRSVYKNKIIRFLDIIYFQVFNKKKYDLIILNSFGLLAFVMEDLVSRYAALTNKPIIMTLHGGAFFEFYQKYPRWVTVVLKRVTLINTPSLFLMEKFSKLGFAIHYLPNFIDLSNFPFARNVQKPYSVLWVRAFHDIYHPELAIEAIYELKKKYPEVHLTMIGPDKGLLNKCKQLMETLDLTDNISIPGYVENEDLHKYYHSNQVFITTTRYESFGVAIVEAASCGIPCVSTKVGEIPYLWQHEENMMLSERDPVMFSNNIERLFEDQGLRNKITYNARLRASEFTWEKVGLKWVETMNECIK